MAWPPDLDALKADLGDEYDPVDRDDDRLQLVLDAAVDFVERVHSGRFDFAGDPESPLPDPEQSTIWLGTLRLAGRWHARRRSPDALVEMAELGSSRIPSFDADLERLLRIGRHKRPRVA